MRAKPTRIPIEAFSPKLTIDEALDQIAVVVYPFNGPLTDDQDARIRNVLERLQ
jgi:hypothetical protein